MLERFIRFFSKRDSFGDAKSFLTAGIEKSFGGTISGQTITAESAMRVAGVYACVSVISETVASLPLKIFRKRKDGGKDEAIDHPLYYVLHDVPNRYQTSYEYRETGLIHLNLRGNHYSRIIRNGKNDVSGLLPLNPDNMTVTVQEGGSLKYEYKHEDGKIEKISENEIWHQKHKSIDGIMGLSPISQAREAIGLARAQEEYGSRFYANDTTVASKLKHPGKLSANARTNLKESMDKFTSEKRHGTMVLEEGMDFERIGLSNADSQFIEGREFQLADIARIFRVPGVLIGAPDKTSTYASAEQFFLNFIVHTVRPWTVRIEQSINRYLFSVGNRTYYAEHILDGLLRGDTTARYNAYQIGRLNGWLSANDIRALENMNPIKKGNIYLQPLNYKDVNAPDPEPVVQEPVIEGESKKEEDDVSKEGRT